MEVDRLLCDFEYECDACGHAWRASVVMAEFQVTRSGDGGRRISARVQTRYDRLRECPVCQAVRGVATDYYPETILWA